MAQHLGRQPGAGPVRLRATALLLPYLSAEDKLVLRAFRATAPAELQELLRDPPAAAAALAGHAAAGAGGSGPRPHAVPASDADAAHDATTPYS